MTPKWTALETFATYLLDSKNPMAFVKDLSPEKATTPEGRRARAFAAYLLGMPENDPMSLVKGLSPGQLNPIQEKAVEKAFAAARETWEQTMWLYADLQVDPASDTARSLVKGSLELAKEQGWVTIETLDPRAIKWPEPQYTGALYALDKALGVAQKKVMEEIGERK
jgi:hypothetical protein